MRRPWPTRDCLGGKNDYIYNPICNKEFQAELLKHTFQLEEIYTDSYVRWFW
jgi:hypothetical protein